MIRSAPLEMPSHWTMNSVFSLRLASCSPDDRSESILSISSAKPLSCHHVAALGANMPDEQDECKHIVLVSLL